VSSPLLLDIALALCETRDLQGLAIALRRAMLSLLPGRTIRLLELSNPCGDSKFNEDDIRHAMVTPLGEEGAVAPLPLAVDEDLVFCARTQRQVTRTQAGGRRKLVFPILSTRRVIALLVVEGTGVDPDPDVLRRVLAIYSHHAFLLARNELDALTGLLNRQAFDERLRNVIINARQRDRRSPPRHNGCFALMDIDHFKQVNDEYGHLYGDEVLLLFSRLMRRSFRAQDQLFRYGGEEFALILDAVRADDALKVLERFRKSVESYEFPQIGRKTVSIGLAEMSRTNSVDTLIARADRALYYAKNHGRNRVCCYERLVANGRLDAVDIGNKEAEMF
jgi:diguanylate cyclase (GGDEF)-like protein